MYFRSRCPQCSQSQKTRVQRDWWMRMIPGSRLYECDHCGTRYLTVNMRPSSLSERSEQREVKGRPSSGRSPTLSRESRRSKHISKAIKLRAMQPEIEALDPPPQPLVERALYLESPAELTIASRVDEPLPQEITQLKRERDPHTLPLISIPTPLSLI